MRLIDICERIETSINPKDFSNCDLAYYSLPSFDNYETPVYCKGDVIKSLKLKISEPVILLSKLNPHIPRVWIVDDLNFLTVASTEFVALAPRGLDLYALYAICSSSYMESELRSLVNGTSNSHQRVRPDDVLQIEIPEELFQNACSQSNLVASLKKRLQITQSMISKIDAIQKATFEVMCTKNAEGDYLLGDYIDVFNGVSYSSKDFGGTEQGLLTLKSFDRNGRFNRSGVRAWKGDYKASQLLKQNDLIVAHTDISQNAEVLGRCLLFNETEPFKRVIASMDCSVVRPKSELPIGFLFGLMQTREFKMHCEAYSNGTTVLHLSKRALPEFRFSMPPYEIISQFSEIQLDMVQNVYANEKIVEILKGSLKLLINGYNN